MSQFGSNTAVRGRPWSNQTMAQLGSRGRKAYGGILGLSCPKGYYCKTPDQCTTCTGICAKLDGNNASRMGASRSARKGCKMTLYGQTWFNGQKVEYYDDAESVGIQEHSIKTSN